MVLLTVSAARVDVSRVPRQQRDVDGRRTNLQGAQRGAHQGTNEVRTIRKDLPVRWTVPEGPLPGLSVAALQLGPLARRVPATPFARFGGAALPARDLCRHAQKTREVAPSSRGSTGKKPLLWLLRYPALA